MSGMRAWHDPEGQLWAEVTPGRALCIEPLRDILAEHFGRGTLLSDAMTVFSLQELTPGDGSVSIVPGDRALLERLLGEPGWEPNEGDVVRAAADGYEVERRGGAWVPRA